MKRKIRLLLLSLTVLLSAVKGLAQPADSTAAPSKVQYSGLYLDTVKISKPKAINDYMMIGVQYGYSMCRVSWNPQKKQESKFLPVNVGVLFTHYGKMFNYMPYFGYQIGAFYTQEGFVLQQNSNGSVAVKDSKTKESEAVITNIEVPFMAHFHVDFWKLKMMANLGLYAGYRLSIQRGGPYYTMSDYETDEFAKTYRNRFTDYERRFDYGIKGGLGVGIVLDPIEIHLGANIKYSMSSLYAPNYNSPYYYRFAYPYNFIFYVGIHYQLTRRQGRTNRELREEAIRRVEMGK